MGRGFVRERARKGSFDVEQTSSEVYPGSASGPGQSQVKDKTCLPHASMSAGAGEPAFYAQ